MSEEIQKLEREVVSLKNRQRLGYMVAFTLLFVAIGFSFDMMSKVWLDKIPLMDFLESYDWGRLLHLSAVWMPVEVVRRLFRRKELRRKQAELLRLQNASA